MCATIHPMSIKILYFASLREQIGRSEDVMEATETLRVIDAWQQTTGMPELLENLLIAVNQEYTTADAILEDGDELAFFPPVTGG